MRGQSLDSVTVTHTGVNPEGTSTHQINDRYGCRHIAIGVLEESDSGGQTHNLKIVTQLKIIISSIKVPSFKIHNT